jgi:cytochrome c oxidase subunit 2
MIPESDLELGQFRLLDVDNRLIIPVDCHIRLIVTGADVLHSFAVPSLGLKLDAVSGRLNQVSFLAERPGTFYGQCSEICGIYHGFMPIVVEAVPTADFLIWFDSFNSDSNPLLSISGALITVKYLKNRELGAALLSN